MWASFEFLFDKLWTKHTQPNRIAKGKGKTVRWLVDRESYVSVVVWRTFRGYGVFIWIYMYTYYICVCNSESAYAHCRWRILFAETPKSRLINDLGMIYCANKRFGLQQVPAVGKYREGNTKCAWSSVCTTINKFRAVTREQLDFLPTTKSPYDI